MAREVEHLLQLIFSERGKTGGLDLEAIEMAMRSAMHQAGAAALSELLQFDPPGPEQRQRALRVRPHSPLCGATLETRADGGRRGGMPASLLPV